MFLLVGLGNPGKNYEDTKHNVGFMVLDKIIRHHGFSDPKVKFKGELSEGKISEHKVFALKPMTFMNKSGSSVKEIVNFYKIPLDNVIVFYDELDLKVGKVRAKTGGGAGGHNGIKDIDSSIGKNYKRVRIGIDHPGDKDKVSAYVLSKFSPDNLKLIDEITDIIASCTHHIFEDEDNFTNEIYKILKPQTHKAKTEKQDKEKQDGV